ncbi:MAG: hypothetical protein KJ579_02025 [Verrucomicrobia bacterium]|nr:hypothetical protein [Verrucomicrobiota bacterium]
MNPGRLSISICTALVTAMLSAAADDGFRSVVSGGPGPLPAGYVPPLISNGSLCMLLDYLGGQTQRAYCRMTPGIAWAGRRYGPPNDQLVPFGHFEWALDADGQACGAPVAWSQTLDTRAAVTICSNIYERGLTVETTVFTPLGRDLVVARRRIASTVPGTRTVRSTFRYQLTPAGNENRTPRRMTSSCAWNAAAPGAEFRFHADAHRACDGMVSVFSDKPVIAAIDRQAVALTSEFTLDAAKPVEQTFYVLFADSMDGEDFSARAATIQASVRQAGCDGLLARHTEAWAAYWDESYVRLPDARLERVYTTAQYHLRANATRWSFPVGLFNTHWAGRFFGWDEMFCYQALVSSNHRDIARRGPEFRHAGLKVALDRNGHYGKPGVYGARYPWETLEDGTEAAPPGFWMDHVFHMSNVALAAWFHYLYTSDLTYLEKIGYPVLRECARFFLATMVYTSPDGGMFIGKCTDLERLGPARQNPFMTSCGAIYTLESAAGAAALLKADGAEAAAWRHAAAKLRESLPREGDRYVPYAGCTEESVASLGGLFPYPLFDATDALQRNAVHHFVAHGKVSGNMYPMGQSVCAWYAGWMASALAMLGDTAKPATLLREAAEGAGCFGELFEINEANVSMRPWFATASGNFVYALNQMLVQCRGGEVRIAPAVPNEWTDYAFKLACHGDLLAEVTVSGGRLARLSLLPGDVAAESRRTLVVPKALLEGVRTDAMAVTGVEERDGCCRIAVRIRGRTDVVAAKPLE